MSNELLNELLALRQRDIDMRDRLLNEGNLYGDYAPAMQAVHRENAQALDELVSRHGWPGVSLVGPEGCRAAWLIAQHSICTPALQRRFLTLLAQACKRGDVPRKQVAYLTERIRFNEGRPQVYGTVLDWIDNDELDCEVEDPADLDARREGAGLAPFRQELERKRREVASEGGKPPADLRRYQEKARQWARATGWQ